MKILRPLAVFVFSAAAALAAGGPARPATADRGPKPRLIALDDYGCEPDEEQQVLHLLAYANDVDIEGLVAVSSKHLKPPKQPLRPDIAYELVAAYAKVYPNLCLNASGWPTPEALHAVVATGQDFYGRADVRPGSGSPGSRLIEAAMLKDDPRPLIIVINAGANTLQQALVDLRATATPQRFRAALAKLRVYDNGAQDDAGAWICHEFPSIFWLRSNKQTYAYGGPGFDDPAGLGPYYWKPYPYTAEGQEQWLRAHVQTNHGALGARVPERTWVDNAGHRQYAFMEGGGTIPFLGVINHGLFDIDHPSWGGWGGRFTAAKVADDWSDYDDIQASERQVAPFYTYAEVGDVWTDPQDGRIYDGVCAPVWRWRAAMYADYACRMDWCVKPFKEANHNPVAVVDGDATYAPIRVCAAPGAVLHFDASQSSDPDGDALSYSWWVYAEAGTYAGRVVLQNSDTSRVSLAVPTGAAGRQIHLILEVTDNGKTAPLTSYRRVVIDVQ